MQIYGEDSYMAESEKKKKRLKHSLATSSCIILFLTGWLGFQAFGAIFGSVFKNLSFTGYDLATYYNFAAYAVTAPLLVFMLYMFDRKNFRARLSAFKEGRIYLSALWAFVILLVASSVYGIIEEAALNGLGLYGSLNDNQLLLNNMLKAHPVYMIIVIAFLAPMLEELTYRQGLFEAVRRYSRPWAYAVTALVFGLIHMGIFDLVTDFSWDSLYIELLAFPMYAIAGLVLSYSYERANSPVASFLTHAAYNILSLISFSVILAG